MTILDILIVILILVIIYNGLMTHAVLTRTARSSDAAIKRLKEFRETAGQRGEAAMAAMRKQTDELEALRSRRDENRQIVAENVARTEEMLRLNREQLALLGEILEVLRSSAGVPHTKPNASRVKGNES